MALLPKYQLMPVPGATGELDEAQQQPPAYSPPPGSSVSEQLTSVLNKENPLMKQAATQGAQAANRRGLLNSSMGVQAGQQARVNVALPIASQQASQAHQQGLQTREFAHQQQLTGMQLAASERQSAAGAAAAFEGTYSQMISSIMANEKIPAAARQQYMDHAAAVRDSNLRLVEQLYGIKLEWQGSTGGGATNTPVAPTIAPANLTKKERRQQKKAAKRSAAQSVGGASTVGGLMY